jgi:hypothetical protein
MTRDFFNGLLFTLGVIAAYVVAVLSAVYLVGVA